MMPFCATTRAARYAAARLPFSRRSEAAAFDVSLTRHDFLFDVRFFQLIYHLSTLRRLPLRRRDAACVRAMPL